MKDDENKTSWNSDLFSENQHESSSEKENFQVKQMIQKIKKVNKSRKPIENLKNIELFDTLSNTNGKERFIEPLDNLTDTQDTDNSMQIDYDTTCADSRYEGCDNGDKYGNSDDPRERLIRFINRMYAFFDSWFLFIAFVICIAVGITAKTTKDGIKSLKKRKGTKKKDEPKGKEDVKTIGYYKKKFGIDTSTLNFLPKINDVNLVKKYVAWTCSILLSCYVVFHLFFLMFYKDELYLKEGVELKDISVMTIQLESVGSSYSPGVFFLFFFQFAWFFTESFQHYAMVKLPEKASMYLNASLCFIFIFIGLIFFFYYYPNFMRELFIDMIKFNTKDWVVNFMYIAVVILLIMDLFNPLNYTVGPIWYKIHLVLWLRIIIVLFISVPFAGLFLPCYIIFYGFCGIFLYNTFTSHFQIFKDISKYAEDTKNQIRIGTDCSPNSFFEKIMITINLVMDFIYTYIFYLAFIVMFFVSLFDYSMNISSTQLKNGLILVTCTFILMFSCLCINSFRMKTAVKLAAAAKK